MYVVCVKRGVCVTREKQGCGPTYNRYWLPGKAQSTPDADIFTAAARWPEADKIFHPKEHHKDDLLPEGWGKQNRKREKWPRRTGGKVTKNKKIKNENLMFLKGIQCKTTWTSVLTKCTLTTCQSNLLRINDCFSTDVHFVTVQCVLSHWIIPDLGCRSNLLRLYCWFNDHWRYPDKEN